MVIWSRSLRVKTCRECKNQETPAESLAVKNENIRVLTFSLPAGSGAQGSLEKIQTCEHYAATLGSFPSLKGRPTVRYYKLEEPR
jgi:hypothetical protein